MIWPVHRGQVIRADVGLDETKLFVVVSNNRRNAHLADVLTVRLTTSRKPAIPSIVELSSADTFTGRAVCDDIGPIFENEVLEVVGALSPASMLRIDAGLGAALDLPVSRVR